MPQTETEMRLLYDDLKPEDRVEVVHEVKVGLKTWPTRTVGIVAGKERRQHGLHSRRNFDDKVWSDILILCRDDGELTTVTMDEFTRLEKLS